MAKNSSFCFSYLTTLNSHTVSKFCGVIWLTRTSVNNWLRILKRTVKCVVEKGDDLAVHRRKWVALKWNIPWIDQTKGKCMLMCQMKKQTKQKTVYYYKNCDCGLCAVPRFEPWHTDLSVRWSTQWNRDCPSAGAVKLCLLWMKLYSSCSHMWLVTRDECQIRGRTLRRPWTGIKERYNPVLVCSLLCIF